MKLINSKPVDEKQAASNKRGIGIANVRARLDLLYAGKYELIITNELEVFIVNLALELEPQMPHFTPVSEQQLVTHANV